MASGWKSGINTEIYNHQLSAAGPPTGQEDQQGQEKPFEGHATSDEVDTYPCSFHILRFCRSVKCEMSMQRQCVLIY